MLLFSVNSYKQAPGILLKIYPYRVLRVNMASFPKFTRRGKNLPVEVKKKKKKKKKKNCHLKMMLICIFKLISQHPAYSHQSNRA